MPNILDFSALLGGAASEAAKVRQERLDQENQSFTQTQSILHGLLASPDLSDETRTQAQDAVVHTMMEHLGYAKKGANANSNPIIKALKGMVGNQPNSSSYSASLARVAQPGVGSGKSKTAIGGAGPEAAPEADPTAQQMGLEGFGSPPEPAFDMAQSQPPTNPFTIDPTRASARAEAARISQEQAKQEAELERQSKLLKQKQDFDREQEKADAAKRASIFDADPYNQQLKGQDQAEFNRQRGAYVYGFKEPGSISAEEKISTDLVTADWVQKNHPELLDQLGGAPFGRLVTTRNNAKPTAIRPAFPTESAAAKAEGANIPKAGAVRMVGTDKYNDGKNHLETYDAKKGEWADTGSDEKLLNKFTIANQAAFGDQHAVTTQALLKDQEKQSDTDKGYESYLLHPELTKQYGHDITGYQNYILAQKQASSISERIAVNNATSANILSRQEKQSDRKEVDKMWENAQGADRMVKTMQDAIASIKPGQSANAFDLILLSNHIGMTFGDVKGARLGTAMIDAHRNAISLDSELSRWVNKLEHGDSLTPELRQQFLAAALTKSKILHEQYAQAKNDFAYAPPGDAPHTAGADPDADLLR